MADDTAPDLSDLVPVGSTAIGGSPVRTVRARDVHAYLQVGKDLSTWIKDRIAKFQFVEGVDYVTYEDLSSTPMTRGPEVRGDRGRGSCL